MNIRQKIIIIVGIFSCLFVLCYTPLRFQTPPSNDYILISGALSYQNQMLSIGEIIAKLLGIGMMVTGAVLVLGKSSPKE